ncbi:type II secretion system F family protein [Desulfothermus sp.]
MVMFSYQAIDKDGNLIKGIAEFPDEYSLYKWVQDQNLLLIKVGRSYLRSLFKPRIGLEDLIEFSRHMNYILRSGIPLFEGLKDLEENLKNHTFKKVLQAVRREVGAGLSLTEALSHHSYVFPKSYTSIIAAGEASGSLDKVFLELAKYLSWVHETQNKIKHALLYPIIVSVLIIITLIIFIVVVIPQLTKFLTELNMPLPLPTRLLIKFNNVMTHYWYIFIVLLFLFICSIFFVRSSPKLLYYWDKYKLRIPYLGKIFLNLILARFTQYIGLLYQAGIQIYQTLDVVKEVVSNRFYAKKIERIKYLLEEGEQLGTAIELAKDFPSLLVRSIKIGETTGNLEETFKELNTYFNDALERDVKNITTIIEPALLIFVASIILIIVISVLWPIYNMLGKIT